MNWIVGQQISILQATPSLELCYGSASKLLNHLKEEGEKRSLIYNCANHQIQVVPLKGRFILNNVYVCANRGTMCIWVWVPMEARSVRPPQNWSYRWLLSSPVLVLGTQSRSSGKTVHALTCWASLHSLVPLFKTWSTKCSAPPCLVLRFFHRLYQGHLQAPVPHPR